MFREAIVLDKTKREIQFKQTNIIQCLGISNFALLELYSDKSVKIQDVISTENEIVKRIIYKKLTNIAKKELEKAIENIVIKNENRFVNFFNNSRPISIRRHQLDLLPMIGRKHKLAILDHLKNKGKFTGFEDIRNIEMMPDPLHIIVSRIIEEIEGGPDIKYYLFTTPQLKKY
jgi:putative nucleotide binding protein